jgi:hypothetical protein
VKAKADETNANQGEESPKEGRAPVGESKPADQPSQKVSISPIPRDNVGSKSDVKESTGDTEKSNKVPVETVQDDDLSRFEAKTLSWTKATYTPCRTARLAYKQS